MEMKRLSLLMIAIFVASPTLAGDIGQERTPRVFTNEDLEIYRTRPMADRETGGPENAKAPPGTEQEVDAGTIFRKNNNAVVVVASFDSKGVFYEHGSGFIIGRDGMVVTSLHVIKNAAEVRIKAGGNVVSVKGVLYSDKENDIAILKAEGTNFPFVALGDSGDAGIGEKVYVMSNPRATENTVSEGVLNGTRVINNRKLLQISASFSEGSSGGPVFNKFGWVIGIATFVLRDAQQLQAEQGSSFAVPIELIKDALSSEGITEFRDIRTGDRTQSAEYWLNLGNELNRSGKYSEAVDAYRKAVEISPDLTGGLNGLGVAYMSLKRYRDAVDAFLQALRTEPDSAWTYSNLGLAYLESGNEREAVDALKKAVSIMPDLGAAQFNLGLAFRRMGMYREAAEAYRNAVRATPRNAEAHFHLGIMYINLNSEDAAMEEYKILKDLNPALAGHLFNMMKR
jgi:Flp pilus assembly protein TadD